MVLENTSTSNKFETMMDSRGLTTGKQKLEYVRPISAVRTIVSLTTQDGVCFLSTLWQFIVVPSVVEQCDCEVALSSHLALEWRLGSKM